MNEAKAKLNYNPASDEFDLYIYKKLYDGHKEYFKNAIIQSVQAYEIITPFIDSTNTQWSAKEFTQAILDAAWENGMRPIGYADVKNETAAIKYHLEDMRALAFKMKPNGP